MENQPNLSKVTAPGSGFFILSNLALLIVSIFGWKLDPNNLYYTVILALTVLLSISLLYHARKNQEPITSGSIIFFILIWLGITGFSDPSTIIEFSFRDFNLELSIIQMNCALLLPLIVFWTIPYNRDKFFGLQDVQDRQWIKSMWKVAIIIILIIQIFELSRYFEILVLFPLIAEPTSLQRKNKEDLPLLTLHIQKELFHTFAVPLSMLKGIMLIMITFIFELLDGNLWLLVILGYLAFGFIWFIDFILPESLKQGSGKMNNGQNFPFAEEMWKEFGFDKPNPKQAIPVKKETTREKNSKRRKRVKREDSKENLDDNKKEQPQVSVDFNEDVSEDAPNTEKISAEVKKQVIKEVKEEVNENKIVPDVSTAVSGVGPDASIGEKAHALGRRVRSELQKPQYNLNHILSTLSKEDFTSAFRVPKDSLFFESLAGTWSPPKDLILFPIELEKYDYRRVGQILLLGFNRPIKEVKANVNIQFGDNSNYNTKISGNQIQMGDTTFNMKTLTLTKDQWQETKTSLETVADVDDISYTGFQTLHDLQDKLATISEKWIEIRKKAEEAVINFTAGLLGSREPIFLGTDDLERLVESTDEYEIEDIEEDND